MARKKLKAIYKKDGSDQLLPRLSLAVFNRPRAAALVWVCLTVFGIASYTTFLQREGFPSINIPFSVISGAYFVNDPSRVDSEVAKPIDNIVLSHKEVKLVQSHAQGNFYDVVVQYKDGTDANQVGRTISQQIQASGHLPATANYKVETPKIGFTERGDDAVIAFYAKQPGASPDQLLTASQGLVDYLKAQHLPDLESVSTINPFVKGIDPQTGQPGTVQSKFDRIGQRQDGQNHFYEAVSIGIGQKDGTDVIKLNDKIEAAVARFNQQHKDSPYQAVVSATFANDIKFEIGELQRTLLEGLLAVLVVGSIVIAIRASLTTVLSMATVLSITIGLIYIAGFTLNTITLFSLILCLSLVVDDTIIMVEAIDAQRRKHKDPAKTVQVATRKVSRAMVAATSTAALSFAPLIFVGGILGSFIRQIPITVITSLLVSLAVALFFIPLFARYLLLGKKQMGADNVNEPASALEAKVAGFISRPMLWAKHSRRKLLGVGLGAMLIGLLFIGAGGWLFQKVTFNIFPPQKDSNQLAVNLTFDAGSSIDQAQVVADQADKIVASKLGHDFKSADYYSIANTHQAALTVYLTPYSQRQPTAPELQKRLAKAFSGFQGAQVKVLTTGGAGPPSSDFSVHVQTDNRQAGQKLAKDLANYLNGRELVRVSGKKAHITSVAISDPGTYYRQAGQQYTDVTAEFDGDDTTALVTLAQDAVKKEFTAAKVESYGLPKDTIKFDLGQEQENQDSFKTLATAFPILLLVIYLLLALQFRSLAQPLLIFMAIPFSLFGITLGLYITDNAFSFFSMLGFFALIGLSIKNTILLTDYANQLRRAGASAVDAAVGALGERFRPLIATSFTAVVSLIPLSLASPFWQGLTVVLIFGLLSSTFLVVTVFPYYYLGAEFLRLRIRRRSFLLWLVLTILAAMFLPHGLILPVSLAIIAVLSWRSKRQKARA